MGAEIWQDTRLLLPGLDPALRWRIAFTGEVLTPEVRDGQPSLAAADLFAHFPVALLIADRTVEPAATDLRRRGPVPDRPAGPDAARTTATDDAAGTEDREKLPPKEIWLM